jgi:hypothetical protein
MKKILACINESPGVRCRELLRLTGLSDGVPYLKVDLNFL